MDDWVINIWQTKGGWDRLTRLPMHVVDGVGPGCIFGRQKG